MRLKCGLQALHRRCHVRLVEKEVELRWVFLFAFQRFVGDTALTFVVLSVWALKLRATHVGRKHSQFS